MRSRAIIVLAGEPGAGKTWAMRNLIAEWGGALAATPWASGLAKGMMFGERRTIVLGTYAGDTFDGTDRMPMNLMGDDRWLNALATRYAQWHVVAEGDRLVNARMAQWAKENGTFYPFVMSTTAATAAQRRKARGTEQNAGWVAGRRTKVLGWAAEHGATPTTSEQFVERCCKIITKQP